MVSLFFLILRELLKMHNEWERIDTIIWGITVIVDIFILTFFIICI